MDHTEIDRRQFLQKASKIIGSITITGFLSETMGCEYLALTRAKLDYLEPLIDELEPSIIRLKNGTWDGLNPGEGRINYPTEDDSSYHVKFMLPASWQEIRDSYKNPEFFIRTGKTRIMLIEHAKYFGKAGDRSLESGGDNILVDIKVNQNPLEHGFFESGNSDLHCDVVLANVKNYQKSFEMTNLRRFLLQNKD